MEENYLDQIEGRNSVMELLESGKDINKIYVAKGEKHGSINKIIAKAKENKIVTVEIEKTKLYKMAQTENCQGVIAIVPPFDYCSVDDILNEAKRKKEKAFILILDGIEDPHNLGSIIRTAETAGVHGIIIPKRRSALVNSTVNKTSAGATNFMKIARVNNLNETINQVTANYKKLSVWGEIKITLTNINEKINVNAVSTANSDNRFALFSSPNDKILNQFKKNL